MSKSKLIQKNDTLFLESNGEKYVVDKKHLVVKLKPSIKELDADIKQIDITKSGYRLIEVPNGMDVINYAQKLEKTNCYESVDYNTFCRVYFTLNDQYASSQDYLPLIDASRAWDITTGNPNIKVAIIDTGIKRDHEDLGYGSDSYTNVSYSLGYDYIENTSYHDPDDSHGTEVGGVAGAKTNNGIGIAGISGGNNSKGVTLISYRLVHSNGSGATHKYADAIYDAVNDGANIINLSIGHSETAEINAAIQYAYSQGVTIVCAAGDNTGSVAYPASLPQTIGVGSYSQYVGSIEQGSGLDLVAPCIVYTTTMSGYSITGGSSFSSPLVAGTVALMLSKNPNLTPPQIRDILRNTATKVSGYNYDSYGWNSSVGYGLLNTFKALLSACNTAFMKTSVICPTPSTYTINNLPSSLYVSWHYLGDNNSTTPPFIMTTSGNTCTVENYNSISFSGTIIADIMSGTTVLANLKKRVRGVSALTGTFHQEGGYYHYQNYPSFTRSLNSTITVNQLCTITLQSPKFKDMNISISQGGGYVQSFSYDGNQTITFVAAYNNTNKQFVISGIGNGGSCNNFSITVNTTKTPIQPLTFSMTANVDDGRVEVGIMRVTYDDSSQTTSLSDDYSTEKGTWTLEVYNATTGEKVFCQEVGGSNYMIDTTGWKPGVYVVKVTIDKEELTEKVIVK